MTLLAARPGDKHPLPPSQGAQLQSNEIKSGRWEQDQSSSAGQSESSTTSRNNTAGSSLFSSSLAAFSSNIKTLRSRYQLHDSTGSSLITPGPPLDVEPEQQKLRHDEEWDQATLNDVIRACGNQIVGKGGFGDVYKGYHHIYKDVAVKFLDEAKFSQKQFEEEIQNLKILSTMSDLVVQFKAKSAPGARKAIIMEWMDGGSLHDYLKENPDWLSRLNIMQGVADGLKFIHHKNLIHRDIKPGRDAI